MKPATKFKELVAVFEQLEATASNLKIMDLLADFFSHITPEEARLTAYLLRGKVAPDYEGLELGLAKKLVMRSLAQAWGTPLKEVENRFQKTGDLGDVAARIAPQREGGELSIQEVFAELQTIARASGARSQEVKIQILAALLSRCSPQEAKYVTRIVLGTLRLGVAEMTFLYGLSKALTGTKEKKAILENAFNVLSDLGEVAYQAVKKGVEALQEVQPVIGIPIRMMLAQRVKDLEEVKKHLPGQVIVEYKYDGERIQAHISKQGEITLYSRRHEKITHQFPDIVAALGRALQGKEAIIEGEVVAIDPQIGKLQNFQILMTRRRKHGVEEYVRKVPVKYFIFDILYFEGKSLLKTPLSQRKEVLTRHFPDSDGLTLAKYIMTGDVEEMEGFFAEAIEQGGEGVVLKDVTSIYEAGTRGWKWIKFKKDYRRELADTFDLVVVGGIYGTGRRAGTYGSLLVAAFNPETNKYYSFTKVGAGFTDQELARLPDRLAKYNLPEKYRLVETQIEADVWFEPALVMEITGAELTISPVHTVAKEELKKGGLALRFPRFLRWRDDKSPEQATTVQEIYELYTSIRR